MKEPINRFVFKGQNLLKHKAGMIRSLSGTEMHGGHIGEAKVRRMVSPTFICWTL